VADIGIKYVTCIAGATCTKPAKNQLTDLIPTGGIQKILDDGKPIEHNFETYLGAGYKDLADPFAELAKALDVDIVIGATYYDSCVALVQAFSELKFYPKSLAVAACVGNPSLYDAVGKDLRWLSGPTQWVKSLSGPDYTETALMNVKHYIKASASDDPSPLQFYNAFLAKWGSGPSYQIASCMAGLYHLEGAVKIAGVDDHSALLTAMNDFSSPSFFGQIAVDKFGRNTVRSSIIIDYDDKAAANVVAPLFAAKTEHVFPIPTADSNLRNMQCAVGLKVEGSNNFCLSGSGPASTHGTVGNFCGTECVACPASTHSSEAGSLECTTCPLNTFAAATKTVTCSKCLNGQSTNGETGATACAACASGFFNDESERIADPARQARFLSTRSVTRKGQVRASSARICRETSTSRKPSSPYALNARPTRRTVGQQESHCSTASVSLDFGAPTDKSVPNVTPVLLELNASVARKARNPSLRQDSGRLFTPTERSMVIHSPRSMTLPCPRPSSVVPTANRAKQTIRAIINTMATCACNVHQNFTICWGFASAVLVALS